MAEVQTGTLSGWTEAAEAQKQLSTKFEPEINVEYVVGFGRKELKVVEVGKWVNGVQSKTDKEKQVVLILTLDQLNGEPCSLEWAIFGEKKQHIFRSIDEGGTLMSWKFKVKIVPNGQKKDLTVFPMGPKQGGATAPSAPIQTYQINGKEVDKGTFDAYNAFASAIPVQQVQTKPGNRLINIVRLPMPGTKYYDLVDDDGNTVQIHEGLCEVPNLLANVLIDRGFAQQTQAMDLSKML